MRRLKWLVVGSLLALTAASPPYNLDISHPGDNDIQSIFPANERTFRDNLNSYINTEHDIATGYHAFQELTTAAKNALTSPPKGMLVYDTTLVALQINTGTPGSPVWTNVIGSSAFVTGPGSSVNRDVALFNGTTGKIILDSGTTWPTVAAHQALVATSATAIGASTIPNCTDTSGQHLNYTQSGDTFSCGTSAPTVSGTLSAGTANTLDPYTVGTQQTQAHGLGAIPPIVVCYIQNKTGELGYSAGDRVYLTFGLPSALANNGFVPRADATNTYIITESSNTIQIPRADTSANAQITAANWKAVCTPYKIN